MKTKNLFITIISVFCCFLVIGTANAQNKFIEPKCYPLEVANKFFNPDTEKISNSSKYQNEFGLNRAIGYISEPGYSIFLAPKERANGSAVIVFPGGGYQVACIDREGYDLARWFNTLGISAIVVKYRTVPKTFVKERPKSDSIIRNFIYSDAKEAMKIVHANSKVWNIDTNKIGVMGFSAGGHLAHSLCLDVPTAVVYKPAFMVLVYPAFDKNWPDIYYGTIKYANFPPVFLTMATNDKIVDPEGTIQFYQFLRKGNIPAEMHVYSAGGHGYLEKTDADVPNSWKNNLVSWLKGLGIIK